MWADSYGLNDLFPLCRRSKIDEQVLHVLYYL